jgi:hypothetical protein
MSMLPFLQCDLWSIIGDSGFVVSSLVSSASVFFSFHLLTGKTGTRPDLTDTIFAGHHPPLKVWILCLYFMGLNVSNEQIAHELALNVSDVQQMTTQLRDGIVKKSLR